MTKVLRSPLVQLALVVLIFATLIFVLRDGHTQILSLPAELFLWALPLPALAGIWLARRMGADKLKVSDMSPMPLIVGLATTVLLAVGFEMTASRLGIVPIDIIGRACLSGLTFGTAFAIGLEVGQLLEQRRRRMAGRRAG